ncbi:MAG: ribose-5-phosphate isomerase RpiA [Chloroflexota bacterium]
MNETVTRQKELAALQAVELVQSGMIVGLGVGSTAGFAVREIANRITSGLIQDILGIPCSLKVEQEAKTLGIPLTTLEEHPSVDLTIDGADEVDPDLNLIKGGGGALLREKILAQASRREIIIVDESKLSPRLGTQWPVPVEVLPFGWETQAQFLRSLGGQPELRQSADGSPYLTDQGNFILDAHFGPLDDPYALALEFDQRAGIIAHGLFLGMATDLIVAGRTGIQHIRRTD